MNAERWATLKRCFGELVDLAPLERESRLAAITDIALRDEVRGLLQADAAVGERFERAPTLTGERSTFGALGSLGALAALTSADDDDAMTGGERIGAWRLVRLLGRGGMGAVYEAVRDDAGFTKRAAIKMVGRRNAHPALVARFEAERRILARLEHRNIAALLDGGVDQAGRPWFALEYVEGERLDHWSDAHGLDLRARVQLFRQACSAVQYAHERLVVHRDIKPANMLVATDGTLKLLDFGIAKLTDDSENPLTEFGASPMTAAYASPEQRAGQPLTTATDIYSLGVVLYELLTGLRPPAPPATDAPTVLPSRRIEALDDETTAVAIDPAARRRISRQLRGALDAIVMMALRPEPNRRYASARELGDDLQRWLDGRTVRAQPDTLGYRVQSFVRRNRLAVAGIVIGLVALVGGTAVSVRQAAVARAERDRARLEQARTERVKQFFQQVLGMAQPREGGRAVTVTDALERAIPVIDTAFTTEPDLKAAVQLSIGSTLQNLQEFEKARPLLQAAYDFFRTRDGATPSRDQTDAAWEMATLATRDGRPAEAESLYARLAVLYRSPEYGENDALSAQLRIAGLHLDAGDLTGALALYDTLIPKRIIRTRADSLDHAASIGTRGTLLATLGRFDRAASDFSVASAIDDRLLGSNSFAIADLLQPYAGSLLFTGKLVAAESLARRSELLATQAYGAKAQRTIAAARMLGTILVARDRCDEAITTFTRILALRGPDLPDSDPTVGYALVHRGFCQARRGDAARGISDAREGLRLTRIAAGSNHYVSHLAESLAGATIALGPASGRDEAERLLRAGAEGLRATLDPAHPRVRDAELRLAENRARWQR